MGDEDRGFKELFDGRREYLLGRCVRYYLKLDADERKEYEDMLRRQHHEDIEEFEGIWLTEEDKEAIRTAKKEARRDGLQEGRREGRREAVQSMQELLCNLLEQRFGSIPAATRYRVKALDSIDELTRLANRVLTAGSLEDLGLA